MLNVRTLSIILTLTFLLTIYLTQIPTSMDKRARFIKHIVAYSLEKQMEMESEPVDCERNVIDDDGDDGVDNNKWRRLEGTEYYLYSVHEDYRLAPYNYVRVLGMARGKWNATLFCNVITSSGDLHVTRATRTVIWSDNWVDMNADTNFTPIMFSCRIPSGHIKLYLSQTPCSYKMLIHQSKKNKQSVTKHKGVLICVKPLNFQTDISRRLIEWIEMNRILGATGFNIYIDNVHPNARRVLEWYRKRNHRFKLIEHEEIGKKGPSERDVWQKRKNEILIYNDCFYNNLETDYVLPIDIDEIILPKNGRHWSDLFKHFPKNYASYSIRNAFFFHPEPNYFTNYNRTVFSDIGDSGKSFVSTSNAMTVFNHYALHSLKPGISRCYFVPEDLAQMNHYRANCPINLLPECVKYLSSPKIFDNTIAKYKQVFEFNFQNVWKLFKYL